MLGKLLKYELKATSRTFMPLYGALLLVALINNLLSKTSFNFGSTLTLMLLIGLFVALGIATLVLLIQRFNKSLLNDEGYLMFTLPVKPYELILSKLLVTVFWSAISGLVGILTFMLLFIGLDFSFFKEMFTVLFTEMDVVMQSFSEAMKNESFRQGLTIMISTCFIGLLSYIGSILDIYLSLSIAQLPAFSKHRGVTSFAAFFVINFILQIILAFVFGGFVGSVELSVNMMLGIVFAITIAIDLILFFAANYILSKHLNLE